MIYYGLTTISVIMFGFMFLLSERYQKESGTGIRPILKFSIGANATGLIILLIINKFRFHFTPFSAITALIASVDLILYYFCSIKSFNKINISLYSVICMIGGMVLPSIAAIIFFDEKLTQGQIICFVAIIVSLLLTIKKGEKKTGLIYYIGVFFLNGLYSIISTFYSKTDYPKAESAGYSAQITLFCIVICSVLLIFCKEEKYKSSKKALVYSSGYGILNNIGNVLLLISLSKLPASAQYTFVTGGTMIVSTIICFFTPNKPSKREIASVVLSFAGIIALITL